MLNIYITNLGKYNEGSLIGKWISLPTTDEELEDVLAEIGISDEPDEDGNYYEEYFITDYETDIDGLEVDEYDSIEDLNELAETLEDLDEYDREVVEAMISEGYDLEEALERKDDCMVYCDCNNMTDAAERYACYIFN